MTLSYWEIKTWLANVDFTVIGSGIVGLNCALEPQQRFPKAKILILEKGILPQGASTKNAGFACFGSLSEIIDDLNHHSEDEVLQLIAQRYKGLNLLRQTLGDTAMTYQNHGGYELFLKKDASLFESCKHNLDRINTLLKPLFNTDVFSFRDTNFGFKNCIDQLIFNRFEGQLDTGKLMDALLTKAVASNINILNNCTVEAIEDSANGVTIKTKDFDLKTNAVFVATNGFASQLLNETVKPARAQVLITKPIDNLHIKGTFHLDKGYYYFRNIDNRVLFGGGRHLDFKAETTSTFGETPLIQNSLEHLLKTTILPYTDFEIDHRWSGIMGVGQHKKPIVKQLSNNVYCGVRLGGMGVAIGSLVGKDLANLLH